MNIIDRINRVFNLVKGSELQPIPKNSDKRFSQQVHQSRLYHYEMSQEDLKRAIVLAENYDDPVLTELLEICKRTMEDWEVRHQVRTAVSKCLEEPWAVVKGKEPNEELTTLLQDQWFEDCLKYRLHTEFWPHSLIEFHKLVESEKGRVLSKVKLFPRENVNPFNKEILLYPNDKKGIPYTEPPFNTWYLECNEMDPGDREQLGLIHIAAKYTIYKFFGIGDWAQSSEKYMDPMLDWATDETDEQELNKKESAAKGFGRNSWVVRDKDDELNLLERTNDKAYMISKELAEYMDRQNAKGLNGQTGTSDEKSFVGSAEVHERILDSYTVSRLRSLTYWVNGKLFPYLIALDGGNTAYSALKGHEWKPFELLREKKVEPDPPAAPGGNEPDPVNEDDPKTKKPAPGGAKNSLGKPLAGVATKAVSLSNSLTEFYEDCGCESHNPPLAPHKRGIDHVLNDGSIADKVVNKAVDRVYKRKLKRGDVDADLFKQTASEIWAGTERGFSESLKDFKYGSNAHLLHEQMRYNVNVFAAFKVHHNVLEMHSQLFRGDGSLKTRNEFAKDVKAINKDYNKTYLKTEYNLAKAQGRMGAYYIKYHDRGGFFVFKTINDGRVRDDHKLLHNTKLPVDDEFWLTYWPPLGWGCRCYVIWSSRGEVKTPEGIPDVKPMFQQNAGATGKIFNEEHPYFKIDSAFAQTVVDFLAKNAGEKPTDFARKIALYHEYRNNPDYKIKGTFKDKGGFVAVHKHADKKDLPDNLSAAKLIADKKGYPVEVREHVKTRGVKNPELLVSEELSDLKTPETNKSGGINNAFRNAKKQGINQLVLKVDESQTVEGLNEGLQRGFRNSSQIEKVMVVYKEKVIEINKADYQDGVMADKIKKALK